MTSATGPTKASGGGLLARSIAAWGGATARFRNRRLILCFHSIAPERGDGEVRGYVSRGQRVDVERLDGWLRWLSGQASFLSVEDLLLDRGDGLRVALTFDDGYADVLHLGLPLLRRYEIPATWFVTPHFIQHGERLPWWDLLDYVSRHVQGVVGYSLAGEDFRYDLSDGEDCARLLSEQRARFIREGAERRSDRCRALARALPDSASLPRNGFASQREVREAAASEWIEIGGHTLTHQNLAACSERTLRREVVEGKRVLEDWCGYPLDHFAYPFGGDPYWNEEAVRVVRDAGFTAGFVLSPNYVESEGNPFTVPRLSVEGDWSSAEFRARVQGGDVYRGLRRARAILRMLSGPVRRL